MTEQDEPPLPEPLDIEGELQILPVPRSLVTLSFEEIRQMLYESIRSHLATVRTPLYPAIALPFCVILPLASRGVSSLTVNGVGRNVSLYGFLPAYLSGRVEACVLYANRPLDELWEISERLRSDPTRQSRFDHWYNGLWFGAFLGLFRKVHVYPLPAGVLGTITESACRLFAVLVTAVYFGGSFGVYCFYAKQLCSADVHAALLEKMQSIEQHSAWYRDYASLQASSALKIAATFSLLAIPTSPMTLVDGNSRPSIMRLYARRAGFWAGLALLSGIPVVHDLLDEAVTSPGTVQEYRALLRSRDSRTWDRHILCGALLGGAATPFVIKHAPRVTLMHDFVRAGKFVRSPRNVFVVGGASIILGSSLGSLTFIARHAALFRSSDDGSIPRS
ncbi:hypothetical protein GGG16DRAFT_122611 [Schizophyllum commune]